MSINVGGGELRELKPIDKVLLSCEDREDKSGELGIRTFPQCYPHR